MLDASFDAKTSAVVQAITAQGAVWDAMRDPMHVGAHHPRMVTAQGRIPSEREIARL